MKQHIALALEICDKEDVSDVQVKSEYLKCEIRKFTIHWVLRELNWGKIEKT